MIYISFDEEQIRWITEDIMNLLDKKEDYPTGGLQNKIRYILKQHLEEIELMNPPDVSSYDYE